MFDIYRQTKSNGRLKTLAERKSLEQVRAQFGDRVAFACEATEKYGQSYLAVGDRFDYIAIYCN